MATLDFRYSKDGGRNWSDWRILDMGTTGAFVKRIETRRLGRGQQWVFAVRVTDPVKADILAASLQLEPTDS
jgi:hypothetical protein